MSRGRDLSAGGSLGGSSGTSRVEPETLTYLSEVSTHYASLDDPEEKELLLSNVLEELQGKELRIATDAATSRMLEALLAGASAGQLMQFLKAFTNEDELYKLAGGAFGSHVAEKLLLWLDARASELDPGTTAQLEQLLDQLVGAMGDHMFDYLMDKHATHVARRLLCVIAGRDVLPAGKKQQQQHHHHHHHAPGEEGEGEPHPGNLSQMLPRKSALAEKLSGPAQAEAAAAAPPRFPTLLRRMARMLPIYDVPGMSTLAKNTYSGPFLQAVLRAVAADRELLMQLIPPMLGAELAVAAAAAPSSQLASVTDSHMGKLLRDECYSRLLEVVVAVAPPELYQEMYSRFLKGRLLALTSHHCANFVIQAMFAAASTGEQLQSLFQEVRGHLGDLLRRRRSGVVAALVAAAGRLRVSQEEVAGALAAALSELPQWQGRKGSSHLAPALMTLDTSITMGGEAGQGRSSMPSSRWGGARLSTPGCAILAMLFGFAPGSADEYITSLLALNPADAAAAALDPSGSRALEALLLGPASLSTKQQLLDLLAGHWPAVAMAPAGSFFLEKAYAWADMENKEVIVSEVAAKHQALTQQCFWGPKLAARLALEAYQRDPEQWRKRTSTAAATKAAFEQIFGQPDEGKLGEKLTKRQLRKQKKLAKRQAAEQQQQGVVQEGPSGGEADAAGGDAAGVALPVEESEKRAKKKRRKEEASVDAASAPSAVAADDGGELQPATKAGKQAGDKAGKGSKKHKGLPDGSGADPFMELLGFEAVDRSRGVDAAGASLVGPGSERKEKKKKKSAAEGAEEEGSQQPQHGKQGKAKAKEGKSASRKGAKQQQQQQEQQKDPATQGRKKRKKAS